jgi:hypothetical protein
MEDCTIAMRWHSTGGKLDRQQKLPMMKLEDQK